MYFIRSFLFLNFIKKNSGLVIIVIERDGISTVHTAAQRNQSVMKAQNMFLTREPDCPSKTRRSWNESCVSCFIRHNLKVRIDHFTFMT